MANSNNCEEPKFRQAVREDVPLVLHFIRSIAEYEKLLDQVEATEESLTEWMFERRLVEVFFIIADGREVGFALYFHNFSTFVGRAGLYLEDLYIYPEYRGRGYGKAAFARLAQIARERGCGRMEWVCLNWNRPSIDFYLALGARPMSEWTTYRLTEDKIGIVAEL